MLFLTYAYPPCRRPQVSRTIDYLEENITVISALSNSPFNLNVPLPKAPTIHVKTSFLTDFIEKSRGYRIKQAILPDLAYLWSKDLYKLSKEHIEQHDRIVTFGMPMSVHLAGYKLKKEFPHIKWAAYFSDPWTENPFHSFNHWTYWINKRFQNCVFDRADRLIFTVEETLNLCAKSPALLSKSYVVHNSFNQELFPTQKSNNPKIILVRHLGEFYGPRTPLPFLKAVQYLKDRHQWPNNVQVEFIGAGKHYDSPDPSVIFRPRVSYLESLQEMIDADLLLIIDGILEYNIFFQSKMADYMGTNRPIFSICAPGATKRITQEVGESSADISNIPQIAEEFLRNIQLIQEGKNTINRDARDQYEAKNVAKIFQSILQFR